MVEKKLTIIKSIWHDLFQREKNLSGSCQTCIMSHQTLGWGSYNLVKPKLISKSNCTISDTTQIKIFLIYLTSKSDGWHHLLLLLFHLFCFTSTSWFMGTLLAQGFNQNMDTCHEPINPSFQPERFSYIFSCLTLTLFWWTNIHVLSFPYL